ncbi:MAG: ABC transporter permease [Peptoniphilaceae bacterium]|nr:ABC transporter permease [Peptoniphilaceae bacterium]MDD7433941.1 ABC transporter permease [Peptoniphilaceae bacterium]MDY3075703.1 ABC transporter permease [Peptoniphilaceae bacterium]MDY3986344.1 ABC transporter permease [Peptoniphilaceae bacterium]MDY5842647.1 ABC transporter permease [Peptoniphilaceae bacterium]
MSGLQAVLLWLCATAAIFILLEMLPGDAASNQAGKAGEEAVRLLRHKMGLDQPVYYRYIQWLSGLFQGDLGYTYVTQKPIFEIIRTPVLSSCTVAGIVFSAFLFITLPLAVVCGYYKNRWTDLLNKTSVFLASIPEFVLAILLLVLFSLQWRLLPVLSNPGPGENVWSRPISLVMPSLCLWLISSVSMFRHLRVMVEAFAKTAYVREARLAGLSRMRVLFIHLLPSALPGIAQMLASAIPYLLGGSMIVESVTSFPGMGYTLVNAIQSRESLLVMALSGLLTAITLISYRLADWIGQRDTLRRRSYE